MEPEYPKYVKDRPPFRFVLPYPHIFSTHAKQRWYGKPLLNTLTTQFKAYDEQYFRQAILNEKILINKKTVPVDYKIKNGDLLTHETIREEPPILNLSIKIIAESEQFVIVEKPPSFIVHTGGGYHYNTLLAILQHEMQIKDLFILHRLDRLTSGLILLSKNKEKATKFHKQSNSEEMKKMYYARVSGNFPFDNFDLSAPIVCLSQKQGIFSVYDEHSEEHQIASKKNNGSKESRTKFIKVYYDEQSNSSLLECFPITGRTHQIRVHLQYLGFPILNDSCYGGYFVGNGIINYNFPGLVQKYKMPGPEQKNITQENKQQAEDILQKKQKRQEKQEKQDKDDKNSISQISDEVYQKWDFRQKSWEICLHSFKYIFQGKQYFSSKPYWAQKEAITKKCPQYYPKRYFTQKMKIMEQKEDMQKEQRQEI